MGSNTRISGCPELVGDSAVTSTHESPRGTASSSCMHCGQAGPGTPPPEALARAAVCGGSRENFGRDRNIFLSRGSSPKEWQGRVVFPMHQTEQASMNRVDALPLSLERLQSTS